MYRATFHAATYEQVLSPPTDAELSDFIGLLSQPVTIPQTTGVNSSICYPITINGDRIVEDTESFNVTLEVNNPLDMVDMSRNTAIVVIEDDDGKSKLSL